MEAASFQARAMSFKWQELLFWLKTLKPVSPVLELVSSSIDWTQALCIHHKIPLAFQSAKTPSVRECTNTAENTFYAEKSLNLLSTSLVNFKGIYGIMALHFEKLPRTTKIKALGRNLFEVQDCAYWCPSAYLIHKVDHTIINGLIDSNAFL